MEWGEIRWYTFDHPDKKRPILILTRTSALSFLSEVTVAPITTHIRDIPTEVILRASDHLPKACAVNLDHLQTVPQAKIGARITRLSAAKMQEVHAALVFALGFESTSDH